MGLVPRLASLLLATLVLAQDPPTDAQFDAALARARELGLPEPPANAPFVILQNSGVALVNGVPAPSPQRPAFRLPSSANGAEPLLCGTVVETGRFRVARENPAPETVDADALEASAPMDPFARDQDLAVAVQLWARGLRDAARRLAQRRADGTPLDVRVAKLAAQHWCAQTVESDVPFAEIHRRLQAAVARLPEGARLDQGNPQWHAPKWTEVIDRIERAARVPHADTDPETKLVLQLVESRRPGGALRSGEPDAPFDAVVRRGFAIVPALLAHLGDDRTTRSLFVGFNMAQPYVRPLGELAADALRQIAGGEIPVLDEFTLRIDSDRAAVWWEATRERNEADYYVERFLAVARDFSTTGPMRILAAKFPERLELAMLELVEKHPEHCTHVVVDGLADSSMRKVKKVELLERIATRAETRLQALRRLAGIDEDRFCARLIEVLRNAPTKTPADVWRSPDANFGHLVVLTQRPEVWHEFLLAARRAEIGLRMDYLGPFTYTYLGQKQRAQRLACLAAFLDDEEVLDVANCGQSGPHAAFSYTRVAMRDFAADQLAQLLGLGARSSRDANEEQRASLRRDVRTALASAGIEAMTVPADGGR